MVALTGRHRAFLFPSIFIAAKVSFNAKTKSLNESGKETFHRTDVFCIVIVIRKKLSDLSFYNFEGRRDVALASFSSLTLSHLEPLWTSACIFSTGRRVPRRRRPAALRPSASSCPGLPQRGYRRHRPHPLQGTTTIGQKANRCQGSFRQNGVRRDHPPFFLTVVQSTTHGEEERWRMEALRRL